MNELEWLSALPWGHPCLEEAIGDLAADFDSGFSWNRDAQLCRAFEHGAERGAAHILHDDRGFVCQVLMDLYQASVFHHVHESELVNQGGACGPVAGVV
jgi:hypothetical protein